MTQQEQLQAEDDDKISVIDILLFLKASGGNVVKSTLVCLLVGGVYYFYAPKMYEASAVFGMATVAGEMVETPAVLLEKMKVPLYFSPATLQVCGSDGGLISRANFVNKIKPSLNMTTQFITIVAQSPSKEEAKACLDSVIAEITSYHDAIAEPLLRLKKQKLQQLSERLKFIEESSKAFLAIKNIKSVNEAMIVGKSYATILNIEKDIEVYDLRMQVSALESALTTPQTRSTSLFIPVYVKEAPTKMQPAFILGLSLVLGAFLGLLVTWVMRVVPEIRRQMREVKGKVN
jgi:hypothetical protein